PTAAGASHVQTAAGVVAGIPLQTEGRTGSLARRSPVTRKPAVVVRLGRSVCRSLFCSHACRPPAGGASEPSESTGHGWLTGVLRPHTVEPVFVWLISPPFPLRG